MIVSFSGNPGSGKSVIAERLAGKLNYPHYYIGSIWREMAKKHGLDVVAFSKLNENNPDKDKEVDEYQRQLGKDQDKFVIEGRTSWYFIPHSLKIYLYVSPEEGAKRIFGSLQKKNNRNEGGGLNTWEDVLESNKRRVDSDSGRYKQFYGIDVFDPKNYDFFLDTTNLSPDKVFEAVYAFVEENLDKAKI
ncbi:MAG: cytidylate kinase family protein [Patescibacteria group bacterium]